MTRAITRRYEDPLDRIWLTAAGRIGLRVARSTEVFAATDGRGSLTLGDPASLDPDDCLAQMIVHELCHSLVQGPESFEQEDWGLSNQTERDLVREHACLRAQASLLARFGLRSVLAPTTEHRAFYDGLLPDPLEARLEGDTSVALARRAVYRARRSPWSPHFEDALAATSAVVVEAARYADESSLFMDLEPVAPLHIAGGYAHPAGGSETCGSCGWRSGGHCLQFDVAVNKNLERCARYEAEIACGTCGACCREAYDTIEVEASDPFLAKHSELIERVGERIVLKRIDGRCPPLDGDGSRAAPYRCRIHSERPTTCRDFERAGPNCLDARRKLGLSL